MKHIYTILLFNGQRSKDNVMFQYFFYKSIICHRLINDLEKKKRTFPQMLSCTLNYCMRGQSSHKEWMNG